jgi:hypothetical protein
MRLWDFAQSPIGGYDDGSGPGSVLPFIGLSVFEFNRSTPSQEEM